MHAETLVEDLGKSVVQEKWIPSIRKSEEYLRNMSSSNPSSPTEHVGVSINGGTPFMWMIFVGENPIYKWMMTWGTPMTQDTSM